jgi:hypothetical protein
MIFRQLTSLGDFTFGQGISGYATLNNAIGLNIRTRLLSWKGDCFFSLGDWVDWIGRLDKGQQDNLAQELQGVILQSYGVTAITSFTGALNDMTRNYTATYQVTTIFSQSFTDTINLAAGAPA